MFGSLAPPGLFLPLALPTPLVSYLLLSHPPLSLSLCPFFSDLYRTVAMPSTCLICKRTSGKHSNISLHRFPPMSEPVKRKQWLIALNLSDNDVAEHHRICSLHFPNGDSSQTPSLYLGKRFDHQRKCGQRGLKGQQRDVGIQQFQWLNVTKDVIKVLL